MSFATSQLPNHPEIEKTYAAVSDFFEGDDNAFMADSVEIAKLLADKLEDKNPAVISAGLLWNAMSWFGEKFETLDNPSALSYAQAATALTTAETAPDLNQPENRAAAKLLLANAALVADDLRAPEGAPFVPGTEPDDTATAPDMPKALASLRSWIDPIAAALKDEEPALVKAYSDSVAATAQTLAPAAPKAQPASPQM